MSNRMQQDYVTEFDGLRGLAVLGVLATHWLPKSSLVNRVPWGDLGVQLFFVLSGFLITQILLKCRKLQEEGQSTRLHSAIAFYARRALRIAPAYYLCLAVLFVVNFPSIRKDWWWHATYLSNVKFAFFSPESIGKAAHFWSLAVEEQFYLVWPMIIWFTPRRWLIHVALASIAMAPIYRILASLFLSEWWLARMILPFACTDSLGAGALLALLKDYRDLPRLHLVTLGFAKWICIPVLLVALAWQCVTPLVRGADVVVLRFLMAFAFYWVVNSCLMPSSGLASQFLNMGFLRGLGKVSYGMYVIHNFVPDLTRLVLGQRWLDVHLAFEFTANFLVVLLLSCIMYYSLELPLLGFKRAFPYRMA